MAWVPAVLLLLAEAGAAAAQALTVWLIIINRSRRVNINRDLMYPVGHFRHMGGCRLPFPWPRDPITLA